MIHLVDFNLVCQKGLQLPDLETNARVPRGVKVGRLSVVAVLFQHPRKRITTMFAGTKTGGLTQYNRLQFPSQFPHPNRRGVLEKKE